MGPMSQVTSETSGIALGVPLAILAILLTLILRLWKGRGSSSADIKLVSAQQKHLGSYTKAQVAEHCSQTDCWIIVKDKVYDVSSYVEEHPGGLAILKNAGGDATVGFHGPQHPPRVFDIIDDFLIGSLLD